MNATVLFFDLDDTLYPSTSGLWTEIRIRIDRYMEDRLKIAPEQISHLRQHLFHTYGTTLRGLQALYEVDPMDYLAYVHNVHLPDFISPNHQDRETLLALPQKKYIFTNADIHHATRVLKTLNLFDCFDGIVDILQIVPNCKPQDEAFQIALKHAGNPDPKHCILIDDMLFNLQAAHKLGFGTIQVSQKAPNTASGVDAHIQKISELSRVIFAPGL